MSDYEVDVTFTPRFPVSLRSPKSRYRASFKLDGATYSAVSSTPQKAAKGAAAMAELMGGYEVELPVHQAPRPPAHCGPESHPGSVPGCHRRHDLRLGTKEPTMSDRMMPVSRARRLTDGGHHSVHTGLVMPAARTIVAQAEQIARLQAAVRFLESVWGSDILTELREKGILLPGDMEAPE